VGEANGWGGDLFQYFHNNTAANSTASGSEALVYSLDSEVSTAVAEDILTELNRETGLRNRGVIERPGLYVLRRTNMPAVLVEMGFISNPEEAELMANSPNLFALGIYRGILNYYGFS
jgi:N-acetylmuramoyl-L-alanine amidase